MGLSRYNAFVLLALTEDVITNMTTELNLQAAQINVEMTMPLRMFEEMWEEAMSMESKDESSVTRSANR